MNIKWAIRDIVNPQLKEEYIKKIDFGVGIARGTIHVVKSGIGGDPMHQDLIWIGWPVYHAFECANRAESPKNIWISNNVYNQIKSENEMIYSNNKNMWVHNDSHKFSLGNVRVYKTSYQWSL